MNKRIKIGIAIVVMMLAIGFAAVTTSLIVNGNVKLGFNESNFDIYFSSATSETGGSAVIDSSTRKIITYSTKTLKNVGDQATLDYVVTNASTQYDANCTVEFTIDAGAEEFVTIQQTGFVENVSKTVSAQSDENGSIKITLKKGSMEPIQINFTLVINVEPKGRTEEADGPDPFENEITQLLINNRPYPHYVPRYDDETGTTLKSYVTMDIYTKYAVSDIKVLGQGIDPETGYYIEVPDDEHIVFVEKSGNKYTYRILIDNNDNFYYPLYIYLYDSNNPDPYDYYDYEYYELVLVNSMLMQSANADYDYNYEYGKPAWATWFYNEGRQTHCGWIDANQNCTR